MRKLKLGLMALILVGVTGCSWLFGGPEQLRSADGTPVINPDGTPAMIYKDGAMQKLVKAVAPIAGVVPYGEAGKGILGLILAAGIAYQTKKRMGKIEPDDARALIDHAGSSLHTIGKDEDLGDLVAKYEPDSNIAKKLKAAFLKHRNGG